MSKGRKYYGVNEFKEVNKKLGLKAPPAKEKKYDENKRKSQRAKFCRCGKCKGMMTYVPNTNTLICENIVKKTKTRTSKEGIKSTYEVEEPCGNVNVVAPEYRDYLTYLFDGVAPDIAVTEAKKNKEDK